MCSDLPTGWDGDAVPGAAEETRLGAPRPDRWENGRGLPRSPRYTTQRPQGRFTRRLQVRDAPDGADIRATYENGVRRLTIPMSQAAEPRRTEVRPVDRRRPVAAGTEDLEPHGDGHAMTDRREEER